MDSTSPLSDANETCSKREKRLLHSNADASTSEEATALIWPD